MKKLFSSIIGTPVYVSGSSRPVETVKSLIINPSNGVIVAIVTNIRKGIIVRMDDILYFGDMVQVRNHESFVNYEEIIRIKEIVETGGQFLDVRVENESGEYLGDVYDLMIKAFVVVDSLYVAKKILGLFKKDKLIIGTQNIIRIKKGLVVVRDAFVKADEIEVRNVDMVEGA